jgi:heat shock protein HtpX
MNNIFKTTLLLGALTALFLWVGYAVGGQQGALIALLLAATMNVGSYWFSDKMVLSLYRAKEVKPGELPRFHEAVRSMAAKEGLPMPKLYVVDMPVPNAFATGRNPEHAAVAVSASLLELLDDAELKGVLAHELAHVRNRDTLISTVAATLAGALSYVAQIAYYSGNTRGSDRDNGNGAIALVAVLLAPFIAMLLNLAVSRSREYLADETGAETTGQPKALASALLKLEAWSKTRKLVASPRHEATSHLFIVNPFKASALLSLFSTHPATEERVRRLEAM